MLDNMTSALLPWVKIISSLIYIYIYIYIYLLGVARFDMVSVQQGKKKKSIMLGFFSCILNRQ